MRPGPHANIIGLDVSVDKATFVQFGKWLDKLAEHVEHDAGPLVRNHILISSFTHKLLNGFATRLHFKFSYFVGVHKSKDARDALDFIKQIVFVNHFIEAGFNLLGGVGAFIDFGGFNVLFLGDCVDEKLEDLQFLDEGGGVVFEVDLFDDYAFFGLSTGSEEHLSLG